MESEDELESDDELESEEEVESDEELKSSEVLESEESLESDEESGLGLMSGGFCPSPPPGLESDPPPTRDGRILWVI